MELKGAVIGCGRMGAKSSTRLEGIVPSGWLPISHAESIINAKSVSLVALSDINPVELNNAGNLYNIQRLYRDYTELLLTERPDIVSIATRTPLKDEIISSSCKSGVKGIYVEKPIANNIADCRKILELSSKYSCFLSYGVNRRYHYIYRHAKEILSSGELGDMLEITIEFGTAQLLWTHPHSMDLLIFFAGYPASIQCNLEEKSLNYVNPMMVDSDPIIENAIFSFENGLVGRISRGQGGVVRILCSEGTLTIHGDGAFIQVSKKSHANSEYFLSQSYIHPQSPRGATVVAFEEMVAAVTGELQKEDYYGLISPKDIEFGMRMLIGCLHSHNNKGQKVSIKDVPENLTVTGRVGELCA